MKSSVRPVATYEKAAPSRLRTRMTRIARIFTDTCTAAQSQCQTHKGERREGEIGNLLKVHFVGFNASVGKLAPLLKRIDSTDKLIDQIVYKLYGLTSDEIKIVEESISGRKDEKETGMAR
jgi:hypothetical protein